MALASGWQQQVLRGIGAPATPQNLRFLNEWHAREGGGDKNSANFNPLNTTQGAAGASSMNSVGVKSYRSGQQGIRATVQTLLNGHYGDIVGGLRSGKATAGQLANSASLSVWGTGRWGAGKAPVAAGSSPGMQVASRVAGAQGANGGLPGGYKQAVTSFLLEQSNALAQGGQVDPTAALQLVSLKSQYADAPSTSQVGKALGAAQPLLFGNSTQKEKHALQVANKYVGTWYKWGGSNPQTGFDCSGLVQYAWAQSGVKIPRTTYDQWKTGRPISKGQLHPGDAVFFEPTAQGPGHTGMYIGKGQFLEAPHTGAKVRVSVLKGRTDYMGARRYG